jgi:hypothetical protein
MTSSYSGVAATFTLDFTVPVLDPKISLVRAGDTATRTNSAGYIETVLANNPRFDYDPVTLAPKGLLIEEQRTNLLTYSEQFDNVAWNKSAVTVTENATTAPDGTATADSLIPNTTLTQHYVRPTTLAPANATVTLSVYAKRNGYDFLGLEIGAVGANRFDLNAGTVLGVGWDSGVPISPATITSVGNGWYRCSITVTTTVAAAIYIGVWSTSNSTVNYTGNGTSGLFIWGAQLEAGSFATSYIPTTTAALARNADVATITGSNFTGFWNSVQGGTAVQATPSTVSGVRPLVQFDDGTANEIIALRGNTTNPELYIVDGGTPQAQLDAGTIAANTAYSLTGWWATNDCKARQDSGAVVTDTTATIPTVTQMRIGSDGTNYLNGTIATIGYYDSFFGRPIYTRRKNKVFASLL